MSRTAEFTETAMEAAREAARRFGVPHQDLELVRIGDRAVLRMNGGRVIARVARDADLLEASRREVQGARWLSAEGILVTLPLDGEQPVMVDGSPVSLWQAVEGEWTVPADLAALLRRLHALAPPSCPRLPELDPFEHVQERIESAVGLSRSERTALRSLADRLRGELAQVEYVLPRAVLHGDANIGNVLRTADGEVVLFDLGGMCLGPPEWDLAITAVYRDLGWHTDAEYAAFCEVYGFDVSSMPGYSVLRAIRELRMTCWLSQKAGEDQQVTEEVHRRIADLIEPDRPRHWHPY
jgi:Ser/Thr protein kinase RdoA (MazF antagonist)